MADLSCLWEHLILLYFRPEERTIRQLKANNCVLNHFIINYTKILYVINSPENYNPLKSAYLLECDATRSCTSLSTFYRNIGKLLPGYTASHPKR
jgi:hypothetical protein